MRCHGMFKLAFAIGFVCCSVTAQAQAILPYSGSILPIPNSTVRYASVSYPSTNVSAPTLIHSTNSSTPDATGESYHSGGFLSMLRSPWQSVMGDYDSDDYGCNTCSTCSPWYAKAGVVVMSRDNANEVWLSFDTADSSSSLLGTGSDPWDWNGGYELTIGRQLSCNWSFEAVYWQPNQFNTSATVTNAGLGGNLNTALDFTGVSINGTAVDSWFDNAGAHRIDRRSYFHNLELNFVHASCSSAGCNSCGSDYGDQLGCNSCSSWECSWFGGFRYFRFEDGLEFWTSDSDTNFFYDNDDVVYGVDLKNNLFGFQLGGRIDRAVCGRRFNFWAAPRVGIYNNHIEHRSWVASGDNQFAYDIKSKSDDFSILAQLDIGVDWQISCRWKAYMGYRVVAVTGVALVENQVPQFMADQAGISRIDTNGSVLLHGGFAGLEYRF